MKKNFISNKEIRAFHKIMGWEMPIMNGKAFICECKGNKIGYFCSIWIELDNLPNDAIINHREKREQARTYLSLIGKDFRRSVNDGWEDD